MITAHRKLLKYLANNKQQKTISQMQEFIKQFKEREQNKELYNKVALNIKNNGYMLAKCKYLIENKTKEYKILQFYNETSQKLCFKGA